MVNARVNGVRLLQAVDELSQIGRQPDHGISRFTFNQADMQARKYVTSLMEDSGLEVKIDPFGNILGRLGAGSANSPAVMCGSHIDSVPGGGPLDGAYGVLSAIEIARRIREEDIPVKNPIEVIVFTDEEGVRFPGFLGSMGFTGFMRTDEVYALKDVEGISFENALKDAGFDPAKLEPVHKSSNEIKSYIELHIEQGPVLEHERLQIGVVDSITGLGELTVELQGNAGHAGTTPISFRRDALVGASRIVLAVNDIARRATGTAVATVGFLSVSPNLSSVIPGRVTLITDFREFTIESMTSLQDEIISLASHIADENHLIVEFETKSFTKPATASPRVVQAIISSAESLGLSYKLMRSGAGHDCQLMATTTEVGMIFVPSQGGVSHASTEFSSPQQLEAGANVLLNAMIRLANN